MPADRLDISSDPNFASRPLVFPDHSPKNEKNQGGDIDRKKFVGVRFHCCGVYVRVYLNKSGTAYEGHCPKCFRPVKLKIGPGGTSSRFFDAY